MKRLLFAIPVVLALALPSQVFAGPISLQEILFNLNGTTYDNPAWPYAVPGLNSSGFSDPTGLGTLTLTFNPGAPGSYFFDVFFDHQLGDPFYNEFGAVSGVAGAGINWQIDEPGFGDDNRTGTIWDNASSPTGLLDNINHVTGNSSNYNGKCGANAGGGQPIDPTCDNDVSMAMGFRFILAANEFATITLNTSTTAPFSGFYLQQTHPIDPNNPTATNVYLNGSFSIAQNPPSNVPEPSSLLLISTGLAALLGLKHIRKRPQA